MDSLNDKWLRVVGISSLLVVSIVISDYYNHPLNAKMVVKGLITLTSIAVVWHLMRAFILYFRQRYPAGYQIPKRWLLTFVAGSISITPVVWITNALQHWLILGTLKAFSIDRETASITINNLTISSKFYGFDLVLAVTIFIFFQTIYR